MRRSLCILVFLALSAGRSEAQSVLAEQVPPPFPLPAGEGLFRTAAAEPLGKGAITVRLLSEAYQITVDEVGDGTSLTGQLMAAYGLTNNLDIAVSMPVLFDIAGGLTKYGTGDVATSLKMGFPGRFPAGFYGGLDLSVIHPFGFKEAQALNVRSFSRQEREMVARFLVDINREAVGIRLNLGYLAQSGIRNTGLTFAGGVEVGRGQIFTVTAEYQREPSLMGGSTRRAVFGAQMNLWWLRLEAGVEQGFSPDLADFTAMAGVRIHTNFGRKQGKPYGRRPRRVPVARDLETAVRVAVVNLEGFEHEGAGEAIARRIKTALTRHGHIRLVDVGAGTAFLDPDAAIRLAEQSQADIVITGRVLKYNLSRGARPNLPLVVGFPETQAEVQADLRIVDTREDGDVFSTQLVGQGRRNRGVRMFPVSQDARTSYLSVVERNEIWDEAIDQVVGGLLRQMSDTFRWFPG